MTAPDELDAQDRSTVTIDDKEVDLETVDPLEHVGAEADAPAEVGRPPADDDEA